MNEHYSTVAAAVAAGHEDGPGGYLWDTYDGTRGYSWEEEYRAPGDALAVLVSDGTITEAAARAELAEWYYDDEEDQAEQERLTIFDFIIKEIRKYSGCHIALCKESAEVWNQLGLDLSKMRCVCQLDYADMS